MKRVRKHIPLTQTLHRAHGSSSALLYLIASKVLRRRVVSRVTRLQDRCRLTLAYALRLIARQADAFASTLVNRKFAAYELSFYWMYGEDPYTVSFS